MADDSRLIPPGGASGDVLTKFSANSFAVAWLPPAAAAAPAEAGPADEAQIRTLVSEQAGSRLSALIRAAATVLLDVAPTRAAAIASADDSWIATLPDGVDDPASGAWFLIGVDGTDPVLLSGDELLALPRVAQGDELRASESIAVDLLRNGADTGKRARLGMNAAGNLLAALGYASEHVAVYCRTARLRAAPPSEAQGDVSVQEVNTLIAEGVSAWALRGASQPTGDGQFLKRDSGSTEWGAIDREDLPDDLIDTRHIANDAVTGGKIAADVEAALVPGGGESGQLLSKRSDNPFDTAWADPPAGPGSGQGGLSAQDVESLIEAHERVSSAHSFEEALRKEAALVSNAPTAFIGGNQAIRIPGNPVVPSGAFDREFEIRIGTGTWHRFTVSALRAKQDTTIPSVMDDTDSVSFAEGGVTTRIGIHSGDEAFVVARSAAGTQNVSIRDVPISIDDSLIPGLAGAGLAQAEVDARVRSGDNAATETARGNVEIATQAEAEAGTDNAAAMTPLRVQEAIAANPPSELDAAAALPDASGKDVGTIANLAGDLWEVVASGEDANLISGVSRLAAGYYGQSGLFQWQSVHPYNIRADLSKAGLGSSPPATLYAEFNSGRTTDFITLNRASGGDTATTYRYVHAPGSAGIEDTATGAFNVRFYRSFAQGRLSNPQAVHAAKRWELDERGQHTPVNERLAITTLADGPGTGITVTSAGQVKRDPLTGFAPAFDLSAANQSGIIEIEATLDISTRAPAAVGFDAAAGTRTRIQGWTHASRVLAASAYSGSSDEGVEIGRAAAFNGSTELGSIKYLLAKDGSDNLGYYLSYEPKDGTGSQNFAISLRQDAEFFHSDAPASSAAAAPRSVLRSAAPGSGGITITTPEGSAIGGWSPWTTIAELSAVTEAEAGNLRIDGELHGKTDAAGVGGGDRMLIDAQLVRVRGAASSTIVEGIEYGPRNIAANPANTSSEFAEASRNVSIYLSQAVSALAGDVYRLQARAIQQAVSGTRSITFPMQKNSISMSSV